MNKLSHLINCLILVLAVSLTSCGYISDKPVANIDVYRNTELQQACKIDASKLGEIFKADQKAQIRCLEENFIQFTKYVRSKNPGSVSESELNAFIRKFFEGQSDAIIKGLSLIFQLNMLLLRDEANRISRTNISPLFNLLVQVNQEAIEITQTLKEMSDEKNQGRYAELRAKFNSSVNRFSNFTLEIITKSPGMAKQLNIKTFILDISKKLGTKEINPETVDSLIFLKRVLVAGDKEIITSDELKMVIEKLPRILTLSFDLYYAKSTNFASDTDYARFHLMNLKELYKIINFNQNDFELLTVDEILRLAQEFVKDTDVTKFKPSIVSLKSKIIGGDKESFSLRDLKACLDIAKDLTERNYFNNVTYNALQEIIESNRPIEFLPILNLPNEYSVFSPQRVTELHKDFQDVAVNIRYFRSKNEGVPTYGNNILRNKYGFMEATFAKWAGIKLLKSYGHKDEQSQWQISIKEFQAFLFDMKPILEVFKLWSPKPENFAQNAVYLADLFQNKSNGDLNVNEIEMTEYIQMILSATQITNKFQEQLTSVCDSGINKEDPLFETECFNENFYETLLNKADYKKFFPRLNEYVVTAPKKEVSDYLKGVEGFARDNNDPNIPVKKRDNILILGAMLNIESTFIRFDSNHDNVIDYRELVEAFKVYKPAIIKMAKLQPGQEGYAQSIFLYMVSKMEIPPTGSWLDNVKFGIFHSCVQADYCRNKLMDKIEAKRINIGKLLYYVVNQNNLALLASKKQQ